MVWLLERKWRWIAAVGIGLIFAACLVGFDVLRLQASSKLGLQRVDAKTISTSGSAPIEDVGWLGDDNRNGITPPCLEYPEAEPILLPTSPNLSSIIHDRLRRSIGNASFDSIFADCPVTAQVQIIPKCPYWELQTLDHQGYPKTVGGDEFYITYTDEALHRSNFVKSPSTPPLLPQPFHTKPFTAAAWITDLHNGRYRLNFQASPLSMQSTIGRGIFAVYFQYTCNIGRMGPPSKENWTNGGNSVAAYQTKLLPWVPPIRPFKAPTDTSMRGRPNLWNYEAIIPVGDSLLQNLLTPLGIEFHNINSALNTSKMDYWKRSIHQAYRTYRGNGTRVVFILSSCVWDMLEEQTIPTSTLEGTTGWMDHQKAMRHLLQIISARYPNATFCWKSCSSVHIHIPFLFNLKGKALLGMERRTKYMSTARALQLYSVQKKIILEEFEAAQSSLSSSPSSQNGHQRFFFLDVYAPYFLSANHARLGDGRHYREDINRHIVKWFVNDTLVRNDQ